MVEEVWFCLNGAEEISIPLADLEVSISSFKQTLKNTFPDDFTGIGVVEIKVSTVEGLLARNRSMLTDLLSLTAEPLVVTFTKKDHETMSNVATKAGIYISTVFFVSFCGFMSFDSLSFAIDLHALSSVMRTAFGPPKQTSRSPAVVAKDELKGLDPESDQDIKESAEGTAVLSTVELAEIMQLRSEADVVAYITPKLTEIFAESGRVVSNSEAFAFIPVRESIMQKPDLTLGEPCVYSKKQPKTDPLVPTRFAVPHVDLLDSVHFIDAKNTLSNQALGELIIHLELQGDHVGGTHRGMLLSPTGFWLIEVERHVLISRLRGSWTTLGSVEAIRSFFPPLPWHGVDILCRTMGFKIADPFWFGGLDTAYLGSGGFGRVFAVVPSGTSNSTARIADLAAVKVTRGEDNRAVILKEWIKMNAHAVSCGCALIAKPITDMTSFGDLHSFIMTPVAVGTVRRDKLFITSTTTIVQVFTALYELHSHRGGPIYHGDPRLANLLETRDGKLVWVDLRDTFVGAENSIVPQLVRSDCVTFLRSVMPEHMSLTADLLDLVSQYAYCVTLERITVLAHAVHAFVRARDVAKV